MGNITLAKITANVSAQPVNGKLKLWIKQVGLACSVFVCVCLSYKMLFSRQEGSYSKPEQLVDLDTPPVEEDVLRTRRSSRKRKETSSK
jgi:hypothetical protein